MLLLLQHQHSTAPHASFSRLGTEQKCVLTLIIIRSILFAAADNTGSKSNLGPIHLFPAFQIRARSTRNEQRRLLFPARTEAFSGSLIYGHDDSESLLRFTFSKAAVSLSLSRTLYLWKSHHHAAYIGWLWLAAAAFFPSSSSYLPFQRQLARLQSRNSDAADADCCVLQVFRPTLHLAAGEWLCYGRHSHSRQPAYGGRHHTHSWLPSLSSLSSSTCYRLKAISLLPCCNVPACASAAPFFIPTSLPSLSLSHV